MKKIVIIGAGGFGREVKTIIDAINKVEKEYTFLGYYDDGIKKGSIINNYPVLGNLEDLKEVNQEIFVLIGIANPVIKCKIAKSLVSYKNFFFPTIIHPSVQVSDDDVFISHGCIICAGTIITTNIKIGSFVILCSLCTVGHDSIIDDFSSIMPSVNISGEVCIGEKVYVGTGVKVVNRITIGTATIIGAGAVVSKNVPNYCTAVGVPARPIKFIINE